MNTDAKPIKPAIVIYTQIMCDYCAAARTLLREKGVEYQEIDITFDGDRRREMFARSGRQTVPQIFVGDQHIGGYDDLASLDDQGELDKLLSLAE